MAAGFDQTSNNQQLAAIQLLVARDQQARIKLIASVEIGRSIDDATYHVPVRAAGVCAVRALRREPVAERGVEEAEAGGRGAGRGGQGVPRPARAVRH
jgi:hypothetical protein